MAKKIEQINNITIHEYREPDRYKYFTRDPNGIPLSDHETLSDARMYAVSNKRYLKPRGKTFWYKGADGKFYSQQANRRDS